MLNKLSHYEKELLKQIEYENNLENEIKFPTLTEIKDNIEESFTNVSDDKKKMKK